MEPGLSFKTSTSPVRGVTGSFGGGAGPVGPAPGRQKRDAEDGGSHEAGCLRQFSVLDRAT
jgi:hypothetical protein